MKSADVLSLRPTQFALGMLEVEVKCTKLRELKHDELKDFLNSHPVPIILAPDGANYIIDHHHLVRAAWEVKITDVTIEKIKDLSHLTHAKFWEEMEKEKWTYLHDQFGKGPHSPEFLPLDVRGLADDPFRSLAWALREKKGYNKTEQPFSEFHWAEFLRKHISFHPIKMGFHKALEEAEKLCHKPEAVNLPGYIKE